jgi:hypothetical protein
MSDTAANEALAQRWHMDLFQAGKEEVADEILAPGFRFHGPGQEGAGPEEAKALARVFRTGFPDMVINHEDTIAAGDNVAVRWVVHATHDGEYLGVRPTGRRVEIHGIDVLHLRDGRIAEVWIELDLLGLLQQIRAIEWPPEGAPAD